MTPEITARNLPPYLLKSLKKWAKDNGFNYDGMGRVIRGGETIKEVTFIQQTEQGRFGATQGMKL